MVSARAQFLGAGHYRPLASALLELACACRIPGDLIMEVGSGTAYYLEQVVEAHPNFLGLAVDLSKHAARRAAKVHARVGSIVGDVWDRLPIADAVVGLALDIFAPRQPEELHRTLHPEGTMLVVTPQQDHLVELRRVLRLLKVDPDKESRLAKGFEPYFLLAAKRLLAWPMRLTKQSVADVIGMGPDARHVVPTTMATQIAGLPDRITVTAAVAIHSYRRTR
jgi:23S rRNA (guanine745-N1)-methyltransferase